MHSIEDNRSSIYIVEKRPLGVAIGIFLNFFGIKSVLATDGFLDDSWKGNWALRTAKMEIIQ